MRPKSNNHLSQDSHNSCPLMFFSGNRSYIWKIHPPSFMIQKKFKFHKLPPYMKIKAFYIIPYVLVDCFRVIFIKTTLTLLKLKSRLLREKLFHILWLQMNLHVIPNISTNFHVYIYYRYWDMTFQIHKTLINLENPDMRASRQKWTTLIPLTPNKSLELNDTLQHMN